MDSMSYLGVHHDHKKWIFDYLHQVQYFYNNKTWYLLGIGSIEYQNRIFKTPNKCKIEETALLGTLTIYFKKSIQNHLEKYISFFIS